MNIASTNQSFRFSHLLGDRWQYFAVFLLLISVALGQVSCAKDDLRDSDSLPQKQDDVQLTLRFRTSASMPSTTRGLTSEQENSMEQIDVLVFKGDADNPRVIYKREGVLTTEETAAVNERSFTAILPLSTAGARDTKLVILGNSRSILNGVTAIVGKTYNEVQSLLKASISGKMYANPTGGVIPMWGETEFIEIRANAAISIGLNRAIARVDVGVGQRLDTGDGPLREYSWNGTKADGVTAIPFSLQEVYIARPNDTYSIMPVKSNWTATPKLPSATGSSFTIADSETGFKFHGDEITRNLFTTRSIYLPESDVLRGAGGRPGDANHTNRCAIVVGGSYQGGPTTYYRIDFYGGGKLVDILRNHLYLFSISNVTGPGYGSVEEAYNASAMNITATVEEWDEETINDIEFDGQYYFGIEKRDVVFSPMGGESITYTVKTNVSDWSMSAAGTEVLNAAGVRTYENSLLGFKYTIAGSGTDYTLTIESQKHNIQATPNSRLEEFQILAKRLHIPFATRQESTDLFIGRESSYRFFPEGSTVSNQITIDVAALVPIGIATNSDWIEIASNTIALTDGVYRGTVIATVPAWQQADGSVDRFGAIIITPQGRPSISSMVIQEVPYIQFNETEVIVRPLVTRVADYSKVLQVRTNLPVGAVELSADHSADPSRKFSLQNPLDPFVYPDSYYPRYASMTVLAELSSISATDAASVTYTARGSAASMFSWINGQVTLIVQPSNSWFKWQWGWDATWNSSATYVVPWQWTQVSMNVESNRGVGYDLAHVWSDGRLNMINAIQGAVSNGSEVGTKLHPLTFTLPNKANMATSEQLGIWIKSADALPFEQGVPIHFSRARQQLYHDGAASYTWPWVGTSQVDINLGANVQFEVRASGLSLGLQQPAGAAWESNTIRSWLSNAPQTVDALTVQSLRIGTSQMGVDKLNNASEILSGSVAFVNNSGGLGAPTPSTITINQYTPQLKMVRHTIPNPIPATGGTYQVFVRTNISDAVAVSDDALGTVLWGATNPAIDQSGAAREYALEVSVEANRMARKPIYFDVRTYFNGRQELGPWYIDQAAGTITVFFYNSSGKHKYGEQTAPQGTTVNFSTVYTDPLFTQSWWSGTNGSGDRRDGTGWTIPDRNTNVYHHRVPTHPNFKYNGKFMFYQDGSIGGGSYAEAIAACDAINSQPNMGAGWRVPTFAEFQGSNFWYRPNCWSVHNGVPGMIMDGYGWTSDPQVHGGRGDVNCVRYEYEYPN